MPIKYESAPVIAALSSAVERCKPISFDIASNATAYSALAAVLAGFSFTALFVVVATAEGSSDDNRWFAGTTQALVASFVGLILTSVAYAVMAGGAASVGRSTGEEVIAGLGFAVCTVLLILAIALMFDREDQHSAMGEISHHLRRIAGVFLAPLVVAYLYIGTMDWQSARDWTGTGWLDVVGYALIAASLLNGLALFWGPLRQRKALPSETYEQRLRRFSFGALLTVVASSAAFAWSEASLGTCETHPSWMIAGTLILGFVVMLAASYCFSRTRDVS